MKTVGEFKKAGLEFVRGDGYCHKGDKYEMLADSITLGWFDRGMDDALSATITEFAWRENTGFKPEFSGLVEFAFNGEGCEMQEVRLAENVNWEIVKKWRPILNQPSIAESDTKQSAIHKAWVALKGDIDNLMDRNSLDDKFVSLCYDNQGLGFCVGKYYGTGENPTTSMFNKICTVKEFTDYCEKMAAEEKRMDIIGQNGNYVLNYENTANQVASLAVNDKPIFTQVMSDNGELPPVGYKLKFTHDIDSDFKCFHAEKYGWEHGDNLEVIHAIDDYRGDHAVIVLNTQPDVLTTAVISNSRFFDTRTDRDKAIDVALALDEYRDGLGMMSRKDFVVKLYDNGLLKC